MDKAARAVRRSSTRLRSSLGSSGSSDLNLCISEWREVKNAAKSFMTAQTSAAEYQMRWANSGDNRALLDVTNQIWELYTIWADVQKEFIDGIRHYQSTFELLKESEHHLDQQRKELENLTSKTEKARKDLQKCLRRNGKGEQTSELRSRLTQLEEEQHLKECQVSDETQELEAIKLLQLRQNVDRLARRYETLGTSCQVVFSAQRELAQLLPDPGEGPLENLRYEGPMQSRDIVKRVRASLLASDNKDENCGERSLATYHGPSRKESLGSSRFDENSSANYHEKHVQENKHNGNQSCPYLNADQLVSGASNPPYNPAFSASNIAVPTTQQQYNRRKTFPSAPPAEELMRSRNHGFQKTTDVLTSGQPAKHSEDNYTTPSNYCIQNDLNSCHKIYPSLDPIRHYAERKSYPLS